MLHQFTQGTGYTEVGAVFADLAHVGIGFATTAEGYDECCVLGVDFCVGAAEPFGRIDNAGVYHVRRRPACINPRPIAVVRRAMSANGGGLIAESVTATQNTSFLIRPQSDFLAIGWSMHLVFLRWILAVRRV